jgi:hypothetical protein
VENVAALRAFTDPTSTTLPDNIVIMTRGYYTSGDGGNALFYYDASSTLPDNSGSIIAPNSGTGRYLMIHDSTIKVDTFGARGDASNNDAPEIQAAIDYCYGLTDPSSVLYNPEIDGMTVQLSGKTYMLGNQLLLKKRVNFQGIPTQYNFATDNSTPAGTAYSGTILKGLAGATDISSSMVTIFPDRSATSGVNGLESGLPKNQPQIRVQYIYFNGNNACNTCLYVYESWCFELCYCWLANANLYNLWTFDCNSIDIHDNTIRGYLSVDDGDLRIFNDVLAGNPNSSHNIPALLVDGDRNTNITTNFLFSSPPYPTYNEAQWTITDVSSSGIFTTNFDFLSTSPNWTNVNLTSLTYTSATDTLVIDTSSNTGSGSAPTSQPSTLFLSNSTTYRLRGTILMENTSTNASRLITFRSGNSLNTYGSVTVLRNVSFNLDLTFTTPANLGVTQTLRILFTQSLAGVDRITFTNLSLQSVGTSNFDKYNKTTVLINYDPLLNTAIRNTYNPAISYYIRWIASNQFYLYTSYRTYFLNTPITGVALSTPNGVSVGVPFGLLSMTGDNTGNNIVANNRLEDSQYYQLQTRGICETTFTGNNIGKSSNDSVTLASIEYTTRCIFSGNLMVRRYLLDRLDFTNRSVALDRYSFNNKFIGNEIGYGMSGIDIEDEYIGYSEVMNKYDDVLYQSCFIKQNKPSDYKLDNSGVIIDRYTDISTNTITSLGLIRNQVWTEYPIVNDPEFTMYFKDMTFYDNSGITIFRQDTSGASADPKRFVISKGNTNAISIIVAGATNTFVSSTNLQIGATYDMIITKDLSANWNVYLNNTAMGRTALTTAQRNASYFYNTPTLFSSIGAYDSDFADASGIPFKSRFSFTEFRYYSDMLSDGERFSLGTGSVNPNSRIYKDEVSQLILDISAGGTPATYFDSPVNMTVDICSNTAIALNPDISNSMTVSTLILASTGGTTSNGLTPIMSASNQANKPIRVSYWARTLNDLSVNTIEWDLAESNIRQIISTEWKRYVTYIDPDVRQYSNLTQRLALRLGLSNTQPETSSLSFAYSNGTVYMASLKIYYGTAPVDVKINTLTNQYGLIPNEGNKQGNAFYSTATLGRPAEYTMNIDKPPCQGNFFQGDKVYTSQLLTSGANPLLGWQRTVTGFNYNDWKEIKGA